MCSATRKSDLVMPDEARSVARELGIYYYETSVFTYFGVNEVFENAIRAALIARRHQRFWITNLKRVQRPHLQVILYLKYASSYLQTFFNKSYHITYPLAVSISTAQATTARGDCRQRFAQPRPDGYVQCATLHRCGSGCRNGSLSCASLYVGRRIGNVLSSVDDRFCGYGCPQQ